MPIEKIISEARRLKAEAGAYVFTPNEILALKQLARKRDDIINTINLAKQLSEVVDILTKKVQNLSSYVEDVKSKAEDALNKALQSMDIVSAVQDKVEDIKEKITDFESTLGSLQSYADSIYQQLQGVANEVASKIGNLTDQASQFMQDYFNQFAENLKELKSKWEEKMQDIIDYVNGIISSFNNLKNSVLELVDYVDNDASPVENVLGVNMIMDVRYWLESAKDNYKSMNLPGMAYSLFMAMISMSRFSVKIGEAFMSLIGATGKLTESLISMIKLVAGAVNTITQLPRWLDQLGLEPLTVIDLSDEEKEKFEIPGLPLLEFKPIKVSRLKVIPVLDGNVVVANVGVGRTLSEARKNSVDTSEYEYIEAVDKKVGRWVTVRFTWGFIKKSEAVVNEFVEIEPGAEKTIYIKYDTRTKRSTKEVKGEKKEERPKPKPTTPKKTSGAKPFTTKAVVGRRVMR